jgi:hypothetical protein|nr:MAG TPA: hypothetical protein [Caudoviricetes sp.]
MIGGIFIPIFKKGGDPESSNYGLNSIFKTSARVFFFCPKKAYDV